MKLITLAGVIAGSFAISAAALAGGCPADQQKANVRAAMDTAARGVTDTTLGSIDLANETIGAKERQLRFRKLTIEPGGIVPWHSHDDRPALIFVQEGEIFEYAATAPCRSCTRPENSALRPRARRTGGRTREPRPSSSTSATSCTTRTTSTCDVHIPLVPRESGDPVLCPRTGCPRSRA
jgi:hypothetical protein